MLYGGTLAYLAPELLSGAPPTESSDLFALGVLAYELLGGVHPFDTSTPTRLRTSLLQAAPDVGSLDVPPRLRQLVAALLAKDPAQRPPDALSVATELTESIGIPQEYKDTQAQDSFLQAAAFVGRAHELQALIGAIERLPSGRGDTLFVCGESGAGKSRLLEEARVAGLVRGCLVLRGQATDAGGAPHLVIREILRPLILYLEEALTDFEAGVLLSLVPDLPVLLRRPITPAPELDAKATQDRLFEVIEAVVLRFGHPLILILDDLQWLSTDTWALVVRLSRLTAASPLLILGSYREEELPQLPGALTHARTLRLERFGRGAIAELTEAILGPGGRREELIEFVQRETEGNVFFMVQVLRALAEDAGRLDEIGARGLPERVLAGGMIKVLERRLGRLSAAQRPLLELAAVMGRQVDLLAMQRVAAPSELDQWLLSCAQHAILEPVEDRWRFTHDKLREQLLASIKPERKRGLHRQAARAIAITYADPLPHAAALARHHTEAEQHELAARFATMAGESALQQGAVKQAEFFLRAALASQERCRPDELSLLDRMHTRRLLCSALSGLGRLAECIDMLDEMMALAGFYFSGPDVRLVGSLLAQLLLQIRQKLGDPRARHTDLPREVALELLAAMETAGVPLVMRGEAARMFHMSALGLNLSEQIQSDMHQALFSTYFGYALFVGQLHRASDFYIRKAIEIDEATDEPSLREPLYKIRGCIAQFQGHWVDSERHIGRALAVSRHIGDSTRDQMNLLLLMSQKYFLDQYDGVLQDADAMQALAAQSENAQYQGWAGLARAAVQLQRGDASGAHARLQETRPLVEASQDSVAEICCQGLLALSALHAGRLREAHALAVQALAIIRAKPMLGHGMLDGVVAPIEVFYVLSHLAQTPAERAHLHDLARQALAVLRSFTRVVSFGRARTLYWSGLLAAQRGHRDAALRLLRQSLMEATRLGKPLDQGLALREIARLLRGPDSRAHQDRAQVLFAQIGVSWRLTQDARKPLQEAAPRAPSA